MIEAKVVDVIDEFRVVINKGGSDGVSLGDRFLIYQIGDELFDPDTNESLGQLEIVRGQGRASHVQERMSTVTSIETKRVVRGKPLLPARVWVQAWSGEATPNREKGVQ